MGFRVLHPEEETRLLKPATPAIQDIVLYALNTGCRIGEIFSLRWQSVDFEKGLINVFAGKTQKVRVVPINKPVRRILDFWALRRKYEYVFYNQKTGELFVDLDAGLQQACEKAEITGVTWHTQRHTFASRLLDRGVDIMTVKELLGHSTPIQISVLKHLQCGNWRALPQFCYSVHQNAAVRIPTVANCQLTHRVR